MGEKRLKQALGEVGRAWGQCPGCCARVCGSCTEQG